MTDFNKNRRQFIQTSIALSTAPLLASGCASLSSKKTIGRVIVIGGGYAGLAAAKYVRMWSAGNIEVVLIEQNKQFVSCPLSNLVLGGSRTIDDLTFGYGLAAKNHGIRFVHDTVTAIDAASRHIKMQHSEINYDRLIIAPGIDFDYSSIPNLAAADAQQSIPHAWKAGWQTVNLRKQLEAMPDGGIFAISIPKAPYRCPPGPYERICQVASYFKAHKPKSKIVVLDANPEIISKKGLFNKVFNETYSGIVDYRPNNALVSVDIASKTVTTEFEKVQADVLNVIPPQRAGKAAQTAGVRNVEDRWCEVDFLTYESKVAPNIHIIGDAIDSGLPKSAHMATNQAKICASAIVELMHHRAPDPAPVFANTCYSFVDATQAMHVAHVYRYNPNTKIMVPAEGGGVSSKPSADEGEFANTWAVNIWTDILT
jgi:NADPH-dependent 2,4-dienoyl-CoA reductase/sulfur reductase-like enzyme